VIRLNFFIGLCTEHTERSIVCVDVFYKYSSTLYIFCVCVCAMVFFYFDVHYKKIEEKNALWQECLCLLYILADVNII